MCFLLKRRFWGTLVTTPDRTNSAAADDVLGRGAEAEAALLLDCGEVVAPRDGDDVAAGQRQARGDGAADPADTDYDVPHRELLLLEPPQWGVWTGDG